MAEKEKIFFNCQPSEQSVLKNSVTQYDSKNFFTKTRREAPAFRCGVVDVLKIFRKTISMIFVVEIVFNFINYCK